MQQGLIWYLELPLINWVDCTCLKIQPIIRFPTPNTGDIIRVDPSGARQVIVSGLNFPTGMTFGPDGKLYVSNVGYGPDAIGGGEISNQF